MPNYVNAMTLRISSRIRQISEIRRLFVIAACLEASLSCQDATKVINPNAQRVISEAGAGKISNVESAPLAPFTVSLTTTGDYKPGRPVRIRAVVQGLMDTRDVEIRIVAPEVAGARAGRWREMVIDETAPSPPEGSWHTTMTARTQFEREISITIAQPGYYRVLLSAFRRSGEPPLVGGRLVSDQAHAVAWLWIAERGGRKTPHFDRSIIPKGFQTQPGILCPLRGPLCSRSSRSGLRTSANLKPAMAVQVPNLKPAPVVHAPPRKVRSDQWPVAIYPNSRPPGWEWATCHNLHFVVRYHNNSTNTWDPLPEAYVYVDGFYPNGSSAYTQWGYTNAEGWVGYFYCIPGGGGTFTAQVWTYNEQKLQVTPYSAVSVISGSLDDGYAEPYPIWVDDSDRSHVFKNMIRTFNESASRFGRSRAWMRIEVTVNGPEYSSYCPTTTYAGCDYNDYVRIQSVPGGTFGDQIWGPNAAFVQAHEYGHAFHENALGGYIWFWQSSGCGGHTMFAPNISLECAFPEGFADYFAVVTRGSATGGLEGVIEHVELANWGGSDGSLIEAPIAGLLYDLTDNNPFGVESHDVTQYPDSYVADVISSCSVLPEGSSEWVRNRGIDHLVYCFQRDMEGSSGYFTSRSPRPADQNQGSGTSNPADVKRLWRMNLYKESI